MARCRGLPEKTTHACLACLEGLWDSGFFGTQASLAFRFEDSGFVNLFCEAYGYCEES